MKHQLAGYGNLVKEGYKFPAKDTLEGALAKHHDEFLKSCLITATHDTTGFL